MKRIRIFVGMLLASGVLTTAYAERKFTNLGDLGGTPKNTTVMAVSPDGGTAVGRSQGPNGLDGFAWDRQTGVMTVLAKPVDPPITDTFPVDVSEGGRIIVGSGTVGGSSETALYWEWGVPKYDNWTTKRVYAVSDDGNTMAIQAYFWDSGSQSNKSTSCCWIFPGRYFSELPRGIPASLDMPQSYYTGGFPSAVSGDNRVVVGVCQILNQNLAVRYYNPPHWPSTPPVWEPGEVIISYSDTRTSTPTDVSYDGSAVVGFLMKTDFMDPWSKGFFWRSGFGTLELEPVPGDLFTSASCVSGDGDYAGGMTYTGDETGVRGFRAAYWESDGTVHDLNAESQAIAPGWTLTLVRDLSHDGTVVVGEGISPTGERMSWCISGFRPDNPLEEAIDLDSGWTHSDWYGYFARMGKRYIWHVEHGYQYIARGTPDSIYLYDLGLESWLWTSRTTYPYFHKFGSNEGRIWFYRGTPPGGRWFFHYDLKKWMSEDELKQMPD